MEPPSNDHPTGSALARKFRTARRVLRDEGLQQMLARGRRSALTGWWRALTHALNPRATFVVDGQRYTYCLDDYNQSYFNERTAEIPIARAAIASCAGRVLEVGNVLAHYDIAGHTVADKYESGPGVLNVDVVDLTFDEPFDLIVSISTLEHVGLDEDVKEPGKPLVAIEHLKDLLAPGGSLLVTVPIGYNPALDAALLRDSQPFDRLHFLARRPLNRWVETTPAEAARALYDWKWMRARCLAVGLWAG